MAYIIFRFPNPDPNGSVYISGDWTIHDPTEAKQITNYQYVNNAIANAISGSQWKNPVVAATTASDGNIPLSTNTSFTADSYIVNIGDRVFLGYQIDEGINVQNGIYQLTSLGLVRTSDANTWLLLQGAIFNILNGTEYDLHNFRITIPSTGVIDVDPVTWTDLGLGDYVFNPTYFTLTGNNVNLAENGIDFTRINKISSYTVLGNPTGSTANISEISMGNLTETTSSILTITGGNKAILGSGLTIAVTQSNTTNDGYLSSTDWNTFNNKEPAISAGTTLQYWRGDKTFQSFANAALEVLLTGFSVGANSTIASTDTILQAFCKTQGQLNAKQNLLTFGDVTEATSDVLSFSGNVGAIIGSGMTIQVLKSSTSQDGYLSSTDWTTFNNKEPAISAGTTLQYWRGDKTFQTLNTTIVPEGGNLYFTNSRVYASTFGTLAATNAAILTGDSLTTIVNKTQGQINALIIAGGTYLVAANNLSDVASVSASRSNLGLGSLAVLNSINNSNWSGTQLAVSNGGTGLAGGIVLGDLIYGSASNVFSRLPGNITTVKQFLTQTGTGGSASAAPVWYTLASSDITTALGYVPEPAITAGTTSQYWRGDKTFQTLDTSVVPENTNLYFTNSRVYGATIGTVTPSNSSVLTGDSLTTIVDKLQGQINFIESASVLSITGTTDQIIASSPTGNVILSLPQSINTTNSPSFVNLNLTTALNVTANTNQIKLGTTNFTTYTMASLTSSRVFKTPDSDSNSVVPNTGSSHNFVTGINSSGVIALAQPAFTDISGTAVLSQIPHGNLTESTSSVLTITGGTSSVLSAVTIQVKQATTSVSGYLSSTDWTTFNNKQSALTIGNLTESTSSVLTITGGTGAIIGSGLTIQVAQSTTSVSGYLSSTDWNTFNNKQNNLGTAATTTYLRGDLAWSTLSTTVVPEGSNLYYTDTRVRACVLTGFSVGANTAIVATDTILQAFGKTQGQINVISAGTPPIGPASGDLSGTYPNPTVYRINGISLASLATGIVKNTTTTGILSIAAAAADYVAPSAYASANGLTMATARLLGRTTASTGAAEEISVGSGLTLSAGTLTATGSGGTVTSVSVSTTNGFAGTATATTTPVITISTTVTGVLKGNATAISAATPGADYSAGTSVLATGILKSTTATGSLTIAVAADFPTLNQNTTGSAATLTTPRAIYGNNFDGSAALTQIIASNFGGTGNGFTKFSGASSTEKTYTLPNASCTILTTNTIVTPAQGGTGVANTGMITIGSDFTIRGAFTTNLTVTANTNVTLPTTGTLSTLAGTENLTNKTFYVCQTKGLQLQFLNDSDTTKGFYFIGNSSQTAGSQITFTMPQISCNILSDTNTIAVQNKTFNNTNSVTLKTNSFILQDSTTTSKQCIFNISGNTASTTRTYTMFDANDTVVGLAIAQSPTNKTFNNTNRFTVLSSNLIIQDSTDNTKQAQFSLSGLVTGTTNTYTLPAGSQTICSLSSAQVLINKILTTQAGTTTAAPLTITAGVNLTSAISGSIENDGANLYYTDSTPTRKTLLSLAGTGFSSFQTFYSSSASAISAVSPNTTTTKQFFSMTGTGSAGQAPVFSALAKTDLPTGSIVSVNYGVLSSVFSTTSTSFVNIGLFTPSFTPRNANSSFILIATINSSSPNYQLLQFTANGAPIGGGNTAAGHVSCGTVDFAYQSGYALPFTSSFSYVYTPNSAAAIQFNVQLCTESGSTQYINQVAADSTANSGRSGPRTTSTLIVLEIGG